MMDEKNVIILSFSDFFKALKKKKNFLFLSAFFLGSFFFIYQLKKPIHYTAQGIFKSAETASPSNFSKALEFFKGPESYVSTDDPKTFLPSYPVMANVVKKLNLQAKISGNGQNFRTIRNIFATCKAEMWHRMQKKMRPDAHALSNKTIVLSTPFSKKVVPELECKEITYSGDYARNFSLVFLDNETFEVFENRKKIGKAKLNELFLFDEGSYVLTSSQKLKRKRISLSLIPLYVAAKGLEEEICVKRSKENPSLFTVQFTHSNPDLAQKIVNASMEEFQNYLKEEGKLKIAKQLQYLKQRQKEAFEEFETVMEKYKNYLEEHVEKGGILVLGKELEFFARSQEIIHADLRKIEAEIREIQKLFPKFLNLSFAALQQLLKEEKPSIPKTLSENGAKELLANYQRQLEELLFEKTVADTCVLKMKDADFDTMAYSKLISDPVVQEGFRNIHTIERKLTDGNNFSEKEKIVLKEELETEKDFLIKKLIHLGKGMEIQASLIRDRIFLLQEELLCLLFSQHESYQNHLFDLNLAAEKFPEKWLTEQKITMDTKLHTELMESITKIIETKNIGYHLEYSTSSPLMPAPKLLIPDHPKLFLRWTLGFFMGLLLAALWVLFKEVASGPSASRNNLANFGYLICGTFISPQKEREKNTLKWLMHHLSKRKERIALLSQKPHQLESILKTQLSKLGKGSDLKVVIAHPQSLEAIELLSWAETVIYVVHEERLKELSLLPKDTLYVFGKVLSKKKPPLLPLKQVAPLLERYFKKLSFSSFFSEVPPKSY